MRAATSTSTAPRRPASARRVAILALAVSTIVASCASEGERVEIGAAESTDPSTDPTATTETTPTDDDTDTAADVGADPAECERPTGAADRRGITIWHSLRNDAEIKFTELVARFNAEQTDVFVVAEQRGGYRDVLAELSTTPPADRPEVILIDQQALRLLADSDLFLEPAACAVDLDGVYPIMTGTYSLGGDPLAVPYGVSAPVLFYNATRLRDAGLDPADPPATLAELSAASAQVMDSGVAPFGFAASDDYGLWFVTQYNSRTDALTTTPRNGRGDALADAVDFTRPESIAAYEWLRDEVAAGRGAWVGSNVSGADDLIRLVDVAQGAAFTITTSASAGDVIHLLEAGAFAGAELGIGPLPGPGTGSLVGGSGLWISDTVDPADAGAAAAFVDWLISPVPHAEFATYTGYAPLRPAELEEPVLVEEWEQYPQLRVPFDQIVDLPDTPERLGPAWGPGDEITTTLLEAMTNVIENGADPTAELDAAAVRATGLLAAYAATEG